MDKPKQQLSADQITKRAKRKRDRDLMRIMKKTRKQALKHEIVQLIGQLGDNELAREMNREFSNIIGKAAARRVAFECGLEKKLHRKKESAATKSHLLNHKTVNIPRNWPAPKPPAGNPPQELEQPELKVCPYNLFHYFHLDHQFMSLNVEKKYQETVAGFQLIEEASKTV